MYAYKYMSAKDLDSSDAPIPVFTSRSNTNTF